MSAWLAAILAVLAVPAVATAADPADELAAAIDRHLQADWKARGVQPAAPADVVVRKLLTAAVRVNNPNMNFRFVQGDPNDPDSVAAAGFYGANEGKAENLVAAVSRLFLGVKLECAQCHDHPFAPYTKEQFWEFAAFFADLNVTPNVRPSAVGPMGPQSDRNRLTIPNTETVVTAKFFDGTDPVWRE